MPDDSRSDPEEADDEARLEVPELPQLPEAPVLNPNLPPLERARREAEREADARGLGLAYMLPTALAAPVIVLTLAGWWLDDRFHKSPWFTMGGALLGIATGFINMIRIASRLNR